MLTKEMIEKADKIADEIAENGQVGKVVEVNEKHYKIIKEVDDYLFYEIAKAFNVEVSVVK